MNNNIKQMMQQYIDSKKLAWSESTLRSEQARLGAVVEVLTNVGLNPAALFQELIKTHKLYTIKTLFIRLGAFEEQMYGTSTFNQFRKSNARLFKHAYTKERLDVTFEEAVERIKLIKDEAIRAKAFALLYSGMRYTESTTEQQGQVIGKGGKPRRVFLPDGDLNSKYDGTYITFYRALKAVGLKPHTLRKLRATNLVQAGASLPDLMAIMGWNSIDTAMSYLQPQREAQLKTLMERTANGGI